MSKGKWPIKKLGELCEFRRGLTYAKGDEVDSSSNVVLRATNIDLAAHVLDFSELRYISDDVSIPPDKRIRKDSLLICTASGSKSHLGKIAYIDNDYGYAFGGFMGMLTPTNGVYPRFLFYLMTSQAYKDFIGALSDGANINNLKFDQLARFDVPYPPAAEQRRIVGILDEAFAAIATAKANTEKNLHNARELFASSLHQYFAKRDSGWTEDTLQNVVASRCALSYGIVQPGKDVDGGLPMVRPTDLTQKHISLIGLKRVNPSVAKAYKRTMLDGGELLLCVRGTTGVVAFATPELKGANVTRGIVPITFNSSRIRQDFGYYILLSNVVQQQIRAATYGAALMQINIRDLRKLRIPFPPTNEQERAVGKFDAMVAEVQRLEILYRKEITALDALKKSLLHAAFSGRLSEGGKRVAGVARREVEHAG